MVLSIRYFHFRTWSLLQRWPTNSNMVIIWRKTPNSERCAYRWRGLVKIRSLLKGGRSNSRKSAKVQVCRHVPRREHQPLALGVGTGGRWLGPAEIGKLLETPQLSDLHSHHSQIWPVTYLPRFLWWKKQKRNKYVMYGMKRSRRYSKGGEIFYVCM